METFDPAQLEMMLHQFRSNVVGVPRADRKVVGDSRVYKDSFQGKDAVDWLVVERGCTREFGVTLITSWVKQGSVLSLNSPGFSDKLHVFYGFPEKDPHPRVKRTPPSGTKNRGVVESEELKQKMQQQFSDVLGVTLDENQAFITQEEEEEIKRLMESRNQRDINALAADFANDIQKLETENVHLLIGPQHTTATSQIVKSLKESGKHIGKIKDYFLDLEKILDNEDIRKDVNQIEKKNKDLQVYTKNLMRLSKELDNLFAEMTLDESTLKVIDSPHFDSDPEKAITAALRLRHVLSVDLESMNNMNAVLDQRKIYATKRNDFLSKFSYFMNKFFENRQQQYLSQKKSSTSNQILKSSTKPLHDAFEVYTTLVHWVIEVKELDLHNKVVDKNEVLGKYNEIMTTVYKAEFKYMFRLIDKRTEWKEIPTGLEFDQISTMKTVSGVASAMASLPSLGTSVVTGAATGTVQVMSNAIWTASEDDSFSDVSEEGPLPRVHITRVDVKKAFALLLHRCLAKIKVEEDFVKAFFKHPTKDEYSKFFEEYLGHMFDGLVDDFISAIQKLFQLNPFLCLPLEIRVAKMEKKYSGSSTYCMALLEKCRAVLVKNWTAYLDEQKLRIEQSKAAGTLSRATGILSHSIRLIEVIREIEENYGASNSSLASPALDALISSVYSWILETVANLNSVDRSVPPRQKLIIRIENFHFLFVKMSEFKILDLKTFIAQADQHYNGAVNAFVEDIAMECLGPLASFFATVDKVYSGTLEGQYDTIQFNASTTNQKLLATINKVPLASVEKAMIELYKKLYKQLGPETSENLLPTVWSTFKTHMVKTYKRCEFLTSECFKGKNLAFPLKDLEASIDEVIKRFEEQQDQKNSKREKGSGMVDSVRSEFSLRSRHESRQDSLKADKAEKQSRRLSASRSESKKERSKEEKSSLKAQKDRSKEEKSSIKTVEIRTEPVPSTASHKKPEAASRPHDSLAPRKIERDKKTNDSASQGGETKSKHKESKKGGKSLDDSEKMMARSSSSRR